MKKIILSIAVTLLMAMSSSAQIADYRVQELTIDVGQEVANAELTMIIDDVYYETYSYSYSGSQLTMYISEGLDYNLIINGEEYFNFTIMSREVIDEQDLSISTDLHYGFFEGVLIFE